jgi:hypothetical protein
MSATSKVTDEKINSFEFRNERSLDSTSIKAQSSTIVDPMDSTCILKAPTSNLKMSSIVKAGLLFLATIGGCYLAKTTNVFSYFRRKVKNLNSKNINKVNDLNVRRNSGIVEKTNGLLVNQVIQTYTSKDRSVEFEEIKVSELENLSEVKNRNAMEQKSINVKNPIPNKNVIVKKPFNLTIDSSIIFNSSSLVFLETPNIPTWLTSYYNPKLIGSYKESIAQELALFGNYVYVAGEEIEEFSGFQIVDVSDPSNPTFKGSYRYNDTLNMPSEVALLGNYAFVTDEYGCGLKIIDISNESNPTLKGSYDIDDAEGISLSDNYAYLAAGWDGLQIIDIRDPSNPTLKTSYNMSYARKVALSGNYAHVADGGSLLIIDISDPLKPTFKGSYDTPGDFYGITISGNYVHMVDWFSGLQIIDISNLTNPTFKGSYDTPGNACGIAISGNYAYVMDLYSGLQIIDISDLTNPIFKGSYNAAGVDTDCGIIVSGNYVYMANSNSGLQIIVPNLELTLSGIPNSIGTYRVNIKACNEEKECATDSFDIIVTNPTITLVIICSIAASAICVGGICCLLIGGVGIITLKRYRNRNKNLKSAIPINDSQVVTKNNYLTMSDSKNPEFLPII